MGIIALFCDINHFLILKDKQVVAYSERIRQVGIYTSVDPKKISAVLNRAGS